MSVGGEIVDGSLRCTGCHAEVPIVSGIPRFVPRESYADNFGLQWNRFADLQVDDIQGTTVSRDRFFLETGLRPEDLREKRVLEAGCGGGRFSAVVLGAGAELLAVDLSNAVDKNRRVNGARSNFHLVQASIENLPLRPEAFDLVFCFGVLQHTPDPAATFRSLVPMVKHGGLLAVDIYAAHPKQTLHWKYLLRPITRRMDEERLLHIIERTTPPLLSIARTLRRMPAGKALTRIVPLKVHDQILAERSPQRQEDLAILETFDAYGPAYDRPRSRRTVQRWFRDAGFVAVETECLMRGLNYGRGRKLPRDGDSRPRVTARP